MHQEAVMQVKEALSRGAALVRKWWQGLRGRRADVTEQIKERLWGKPYLALEGIGCSLRAGVLTLRGQVGTSALKDIAEAVVRRIEGVGRVVNEIEVVPAVTGGSAGDRRVERARRAGPTSPAS
jgi:osmotically-inducible protein OsmY